MTALKQIDLPKGNIGLIPLGDLKFAIVDPQLYPSLNRHKWRAVKSSYKFYAVRDRPWGDKTYTIKMHRVVAKTPKEMVCHHINHNSLDNRRSNLQNMDPVKHRLEHATSRLQVLEAN